MLKSIIIEGVDRLGKDTLVSGIKNQLGFFQVIHYQKPELLESYVNTARVNLSREIIDEQVKSSALKSYQVDCFRTMFHLLSSSGRFILNRAHLGETVYAPRYRKYDGSYVFDLERRFTHDEGSSFADTTLLVLLQTSSFDFITDDGQSLDVSQREEEQNDFIRAFERSEITHKLMVDVHDGEGSFVPRDLILSTVVQAFKELPSMQHPIWYVSWTKSTDGVGYDRHSYLSPDPKKIVAL